MIDARIARIGRLFRRRDESGRPDMPLLSVYRDLGVVPRDGRDDNFNRPGEDLSLYQVVRSGDLVLNKMKTWQGSLGISQHDGIVSPAYFVAAPTSQEHPRYLHYVLRSSGLVAEYARFSKGIRPNQWDLPWEAFRTIAIALPSIRKQCEIADYLDRETARIDALIASKQRMMSTLRARLQTVIDQAVGSAEERRRLRFVVSRLTSGPRGWAEFECDNGTPFLRISNVSGPGLELKLENLSRVCPPVGAEAARVATCSDDVLLTITADIGSVKVVSAELAGAVVSQHLALMTPTGCSGRWLAYAIATTDAQCQLDAARYGGTKTQLSLDDIREIVIPLAAAGEAGVVASLDAEASRAETLLKWVASSVALLSEYRQSLITTAIMGKLLIPGAAV